MKIAVYAIAKNEAKFVERFINSARDADCILIADTGSADGTPDAANVYIQKVMALPRCMSNFELEELTAS